MSADIPNSSPVKLSLLPKYDKPGLRRDETVEQYLLKKITDKVFLPGAKLPSTAEVSTQLGVNINSVQKALMRLSARGFLVRKPNFGTIINDQADTPLNVFLLIGPCLREETCHFDRRLSRLIENELFSRGYNPILYDGLDQIFDRNSSTGSRLISQLCADFAHFDPKAVVEQNFVSLRVPELARGGSEPVVAFRSVAQGGDVCFDSAYLYSEAVRAAAERGRRNIIFALNIPEVSFESINLKALWKSAKEHGIGVSKILYVGNNRAPPAPEQILEELLTRELQDWKRLPPRKRPDTLILMDDILMRSAAICLLREGIRVPEDMLAVSLVNEGIDLGFGVPVVGIEIPLSAAAVKLVDILDVRLGRVAGPDPSPLQIRGRIVDAGEKSAERVNSQKFSLKERGGDAALQ